jgi:hypothetical protein
MAGQYTKVHNHNVAELLRMEKRGKVTIAKKCKITSRSIVFGRMTVLGFVLIGLGSGCSTNTAATSSSQSTGSTLAAAQPASASPAPAANPETTGSAQAATATPSPAMPSQEHLVGIGSETVVTIHGKIVSVNHAKKEVTLEGPDGKQVTLHVYNPYNLAAAKAGGPFVAKFYEIVTIRKLKQGESLPAASVAEGIVGAVPGQTPGVAAGTKVQIVVTINAINQNKKTIEVKGPDGSVETVSVGNGASLKHVRVGEKIAITSFNVVAVALEPEAGS